MNLGKSSNPVFGKSVFRNAATEGIQNGVMTVNGAIHKTAILTLLVVLGATYTWNLFFQSPNPQAYVPFMIGGAIGGLIMAFVTIFKKEWAKITAPIYAIFEGLFLGGLSSFAHFLYPGIVMQAVALTFGVLFLMLLLYRSGIIKVTEKFKMGVVAATGAVALVYFIGWIGHMFGFSTGILYGNSLISIGVSIVVVVIAALNLVLDFQFFEEGAEQGAPKHMEWFAAFGLMVTLVWLYVEILRLLMKIASRD